MVLFIVKVDELDIPDPELWKYVYDTTISETICKNQNSAIQSAVDTLLIRAAADKFQLNEGKCKELRICFKAKNNPISILLLLTTNQSMLWLVPRFLVLLWPVILSGMAISTLL